MTELILGHMGLALLTVLGIWFWNFGNEEKTICEKIKWNNKSHNKIFDDHGDE